MKVISEIEIGNFKILKLDSNKPDHIYTKYVIDGQEYDIVPMRESSNHIAVKSKENFIGKCVSFE